MLALAIVFDILVFVRKCRARSLYVVNTHVDATEVGKQIARALQSLHIFRKLTARPNPTNEWLYNLLGIASDNDPPDYGANSDRPSTGWGLHQAARQNPNQPWEFFISYRCAESQAEANMLQHALATVGLRAYVCNTMPGGNMLIETSCALAKSAVFVVMGTQTYGRNTPAPNNTLCELLLAHDLGKPLYLIKMFSDHQNFRYPWVNMLLNSSVVYKEWIVGTEMPQDLIQNMSAKLSSVTAPVRNNSNFDANRVQPYTDIGMAEAQSEMAFTDNCGNFGAACAAVVPLINCSPTNERVSITTVRKHVFRWLGLIGLIVLVDNLLV